MIDDIIFVFIIIYMNIMATYRRITHHCTYYSYILAALGFRYKAEMWIAPYLAHTRLPTSYVENVRMLLLESVLNNTSKSFVRPCTPTNSFFSMDISSHDNNGAYHMLLYYLFSK